MQHKAFWSALEYTCRLLGISTAAGKSKSSLSLGLKGTEWVLRPPGCLPAFGQLQLQPHPKRGTRKLVHFCLGIQGGRHSETSERKRQHSEGKLKHTHTHEKKNKTKKLYYSKADIGISKDVNETEKQKYSWL